MTTPAPSVTAAAAEQPPLTEEQQEAVTQFVTLTNEDTESAVAFLRRSGWSVTVGVF